MLCSSPFGPVGGFCSQGGGEEEDGGGAFTLRYTADVKKAILFNNPSVMHHGPPFTGRYSVPSYVMLHRGALYTHGTKRTSYTLLTDGPSSHTPQCVACCGGYGSGTCSDANPTSQTGAGCV